MASHTTYKHSESFISPPAVKCVGLDEPAQVYCRAVGNM